jgi:hypothetical protein
MKTMILAAAAAIALAQPASAQFALNPFADSIRR